MKTIPLTRGAVAIVDDEDYLRASQFSWYAQSGANGTMYAVRRGPRDANGHRKTYYLHRLVMGVGPYERGGLEAMNRANNKRERLCLYCGANYIPSWSGARYCSLSCARRSRPAPERTLADRLCPACGSSFRPHNHTSRYCSKPCSNRGRWRVKEGLR